jgi:hypothetical protein
MEDLPEIGKVVVERDRPHEAIRQEGASTAVV